MWVEVDPFQPFEKFCQHAMYSHTSPSLDHRFPLEAKSCEYTCLACYLAQVWMQAKWANCKNKELDRPRADDILLRERIDNCAHHRDCR